MTLMKKKKSLISLFFLLTLCFIIPLPAKAEQHDVYKAVIVEEQERNEQISGGDKKDTKTDKKPKKDNKKAKKDKKKAKKNSTKVKSKIKTKESNITIKRAQAPQTETPAPEEVNTMDDNTESIETYLADMRAILLIILCISGISSGILLFMTFAKGVHS